MVKVEQGQCRTARSVQGQQGHPSLVRWILGQQGEPEVSKSQQGSQFQQGTLMDQPTNQHTRSCIELLRAAKNVIWLLTSLYWWNISGSALLWSLSQRPTHAVGILYCSPGHSSPGSTYSHPCSKIVRERGGERVYSTCSKILSSSTLDETWLPRQL